MPIQKYKIYTLIFTACMAGYIWLYILLSIKQTEVNNINVCFIKRMTDIPCPSCGSSRSILYLINGEFLQSVLTNPLGLIIITIMIASPLWILFDLATKKESLYYIYSQIEIQLRKKEYAIPCILLVILNWIWNIKKGL